MLLKRKVLVLQPPRRRDARLGGHRLAIKRGALVRVLAVAPGPHLVEGERQRRGEALRCRFLPAGEMTRDRSSAGSTATATDSWFLAAARSIAGPPMSMFSIASA